MRTPGTCLWFELTPEQPAVTLPRAPTEATVRIEDISVDVWHGGRSSLLRATLDGQLHFEREGVALLALPLLDTAPENAAVSSGGKSRLPAPIAVDPNALYTMRAEGLACPIGVRLYFSLGGSR